jgi:1,4-alpha-glucan branching enzyme
MGKGRSYISDVSLFTDHDIYLFKEGSHFKLYDKLGAHLIREDTEVEGRWLRNLGRVY